LLSDLEALQDQFRNEKDCLEDEISRMKSDNEAFRTQIDSLT
jgi:hypothetical protein